MGGGWLSDPRGWAEQGKLESACLVGGGAKEMQPESEIWPEAKQEQKKQPDVSLPPGTTGGAAQRPAAREPCHFLPQGTGQEEGGSR